MFLTPAEGAVIDAQVARIEARTGVQIATAIVGKSDTYVELPWKAFALGASLAAFGTVLADSWRPQWTTASTAQLCATAMLGVGGACALLAIFVPPFARLFLRAHRAEHEVTHHAQSLFLTRELFRTGSRRAALVLVSVFERRVEILADTGLHDRVTEAEWHAVIARITPHMRSASPSRALREGLDAVEALLVSKGFVAAGAVSNELPDDTIEERGV